MTWRRRRPHAARRKRGSALQAIVTGAWDAFAAAVGAGAVDPGVVALACGTWHSFTLAVEPGWPAELVHEGMNICPHPGPTGFGILGTNPNGMSVIDWARELFSI